MQNSGSGWGRWLAAGLLAVSSIPLGLAWRAESVRQSAPEPVAISAGEALKWQKAGEIAVQLRDGSDDATLTDLNARLGLNLAWKNDASRETEVAQATVPAGKTAEQVLADLRADGHVEAADVVHLFFEPGAAPDNPETFEEVSRVPDAVNKTDEESTGKWKPNDPRYNEQWNFRMVKAEEAWEVTRGKGVVVAVIDTGVAYDTNKKGKQGRDFGDTKFVKGYDFVNRDEMPNDDQGHGTHVAGTIAESTDNKEGVAGLAFEATIMPLKVLSASGSGSSADIASAIRWAADHGADIINMSLGGPYPDSLMRSACEYAHNKGVAIVCAAGNSFREGVGYPAAYKDCIAVSAVGPKGDLSFYSSWGKQVAIAAPGGDKKVDPDNGGILQNTVFPDDNGNLVDDYYAFQGTSMASPHVAAVAALIRAQGVKDPDDIKSILQKSATPKGPANKYGAGILDAAKAAKLAGNTHGDGVARFWMVAALFAGCFAVGKLRERSGSSAGYPFWGTSALAFGLLFPDWLSGFVGLSSHANLIGHSILIPGALLVLGAEGKTERRLLGWMALGLTLHVGWEFLRGTTPVGVGTTLLQTLPWAAANVCIGLSILLKGLTTTQD